MRCACSELSLACVPLAAGWNSSSPVSHKYNKVHILIFYQSTMTLLVIDFTYLEGRDDDIVFKELAAVDSHSNRFSSYVFKRPYGWEEIPMFNGRMNEAIYHGCN